MNANQFQYAISVKLQTFELWKQLKRFLLIWWFFLWLISFNVLYKLKLRIPLWIEIYEIVYQTMWKVETSLQANSCFKRGIHWNIGTYIYRTCASYWIRECKKSFIIMFIFENNKWCNLTLKVILVQKKTPYCLHWTNALLSHSGLFHYDWFISNRISLKQQ